MTSADTRLAKYLHRCQQRVEMALDQWLPGVDVQPTTLHQAMRYAALGEGKRVRPMLVYATAEALGLEPERLNGAAAAVELIHAYSLVHDDLPAMDDDDLRRGRPTCHRKFDEATAILAGDALQTLAFRILAHDETLSTDPGVRLRMIDTLALASGSRGMAGGQALDLAATGQELSLAELENLHIHKTGALIRASVQLALLASENPDDAACQGLDRYAKCVGLAFQVQDDILDVESDTETLGKTQGKDQAQNKATYPSLLGLAEARAMAARLTEEAQEALSVLDQRADPLRWLANYIIQRKH